MSMNASLPGSAKLPMPPVAVQPATLPSHVTFHVYTPLEVHPSDGTVTKKQFISVLPDCNCLGDGFYVHVCQCRQAFDSSPWVQYCFCFLVLGCLLEASQLQLRDEFGHYWAQTRHCLPSLPRPRLPPLPPLPNPILLLLPSGRDQAQVALSLAYASRWWILTLFRLAAVSSLFPLPWRSGRCEVFDSYLSLRPPAFLPSRNAFPIAATTTTHRGRHSNSPRRSPTIVGEFHDSRPSSQCFCIGKASTINFDSHPGRHSSLPWPQHPSQRPWSLEGHTFLTDQPAWLPHLIAQDSGQHFTMAPQDTYLDDEEETWYAPTRSWPTNRQRSHLICCITAAWRITYS